MAAKTDFIAECFEELIGSKYEFYVGQFFAC
jgi:hypothetical protein